MQKLNTRVVSMDILQIIDNNRRTKYTSFLSTTNRSPVNITDGIWAKSLLKLKHSFEFEILPNATGVENKELYIRRRVVVFCKRVYFYYVAV